MTEPGTGTATDVRLWATAALLVVLLPTASVLAMIALIQLWPSTPASSSTASSSSTSTTTVPAEGATTSTTLPTSAPATSASTLPASASTTLPASAQATSPSSTLPGVGGLVPTSPASPSTVTATVTVTADRYVVLGHHVRIPPERDLLLIVVLAGGLGGLLHGIRSLVWYLGRKQFHPSWLAFYLSLPIVASTLALIVALVMRGGLVATANVSVDVNPYALAAIAALVGLFSYQAAEKLKSVFETLFAKAPSADAPASPSITKIDPDHAAPGAAITITGTALTGTTMARFGSITAAPPRVHGDTSVEVLVPPDATTGPISLVTPAGTATSPTLTVGPATPATPGAPAAPPTT